MEKFLRLSDRTSFGVYSIFQIFNEEPTLHRKNTAECSLINDVVE